MMYLKTSFDIDNHNDKRDLKQKIRYLIIAVNQPAGRQRHANNPFLISLFCDILNNRP